MFKYLFMLMFFISTASAAPYLKISAGNDQLALNETTTVTFTFSEAVTDFTLSDVNILPTTGGSFTTGLSGSGTTYTVTFRKDNGYSTSLVVDNNTFSPAGVGSTFGFNKFPVYYVNSGGSTYASNKIKAVPQPRCALPGEVLANPSTPTVEKFYTLESTTANSLYYNEAKDKCLVRLQSGQRWEPAATPKPWDAISPHGVHNHSTLMPKVTNQESPRISGTTKFIVRPQNHDCDRATEEGHCTDQGAWRVNFKSAKMGKDDPILYPNQQGAAHHHTFYGNASVNYQTNSASLVKDCNSVAAGGKANCTGYWAPSMIDTAIDMALNPDTILVYYKSTTPVSGNEPLPQGLKIIAGKPSNSTSDQFDDRDFQCINTDTNTYSGSSESIPVCDGGNWDRFTLAIHFPACVADDGTGKMVLDSVDHRSHLIHPQNPSGGTYLGSPILPNWCTEAFPHKIPQVSINLFYNIKKGQNTGNWRLSSDNYSSALPGGRSMHADWWGGWDTRFAQRMVDNCSNKAMDCGINYMGLNAGVGIASITTSGNVGTITTTVPHLLPIGTVPWVLHKGTKIDGRISGVTGVEASKYNYDPTSTTNRQMNSDTGVYDDLPVGSQPLTVINATQLTYVLNGTPSNTTVNTSAAKLQWGEELCELGTICPQAYSDYYYP